MFRIETSGVTRRTHKTQCAHFPGLFFLGGVGWGGEVGKYRPPPSPPPQPPNYTHTAQCHICKILITPVETPYPHPHPPLPQNHNYHVSLQVGPFLATNIAVWHRMWIAYLTLVLGNDWLSMTVMHYVTYAICDDYSSNNELSITAP